MNISMAARKSFLAVLITAVVACTAAAKPMWTTQPLAVDPKENATPCDWLEFYARPHDGGMQIAYRCAGQVDFSFGAAYSVYLDTDGKRETGYRGSDDQFPIGADYLLQGATLYRYDGDTVERHGLDWLWTSVCVVTYNLDGQWVDFAVTADQLPISAAEINVILIGDNVAGDVRGNYNDAFPDSALLKSKPDRFIRVPMKK